MVILALGQVGSGKSRLLRMLTAGRLTRFPQCSAVVHDPNEQWQGGHPFGTVAEARAYIQKRGAVPRLLLVRRDSASRVCRLAWDIGSTTCVIDELDTVCSAKRWSDEEKISEYGKGAAYCLAHYGRHRQVDLFGSFRSTRNVNEDLPGRANYVFVMRHSAGARFDLLMLGQRFGESYAGEAVNLEDHECLVWTDKQ